jgi:hypothetical protein
MGHYRKKPVIVEAVRFDGCEYVDDIPEPMFEGSFDIVPDWITDAEAKGEGEAGALYVDRLADDEIVLTIVTLEGALYAKAGDWIIQGTAGELYPCKPDIFAAIYDPVDAASADALYGAGNHEVGSEPGVGRTELTTGEEGDDVDA